MQHLTLRMPQEQFTYDEVQEYDNLHDVLMKIRQLWISEEIEGAAFRSGSAKQALQKVYLLHSQQSMQDLQDQVRIAYDSYMSYHLFKTEMEANVAEMQNQAIPRVALVICLGLDEKLENFLKIYEH